MLKKIRLIILFLLTIGFYLKSIDCCEYENIRRRSRSPVNTKNYDWVNLSLDQWTKDVNEMLPEYCQPWVRRLISKKDHSLQWQSYPIELFSPIVKEESLFLLLKQFKNKFIKQEWKKISFLENSRVVVIGDIHGSLHSLLRNLSQLKNQGIINDQWEIINKNDCILFTGDYGDRGRYSVEVLITLMIFKIKNSEENVVLLRGNHENLSDQLPFFLGFSAEIEAKYYNNCKEVSDEIYDLFDYFPYVSLLGKGNDYILCCHGGLPYFWNNKDMKNLRDFLQSGKCELLEIKEKVRHQLMWNDFVRGGSLKKSLRDNFSCKIKEVGVGLVPSILKKISTKNCLIHAVFRGHFHTEHVVSVLNDKINISKKNNSEWRSLGDLLPINVRGHLIYKFMSCPEGLGWNNEGFGILTIKGDYSEWQLQEYSYRLS